MCIREFYRGRKKCKYKLEIRHLRCSYCVRYDGLDVDPKSRQQNQFQGRSSLYLNTFLLSGIFIKPNDNKCSFLFIALVAKKSVTM